jgi:predicted MFS family arabinose efflux permease
MEAAGPVSIWRLAAAGHATLLLAMGIGRFSYTPMVPPLITSGSLSEAEAGYVGACNLAGYLAGAVCIPAARRRLAAVPMLHLAILVCFLGIAASAVPAGFLWLAACRFVIGAAASWMMVLALSIVVGNAPRETLGRATGTVFTGVGVGIAFSGVVVPTLLGMGLVYAWIGLAVVGAVATAVALWGWAAAPSAGPEPPRVRKLWRHWKMPAQLKRLPVWMLLAAHAMFSIGLVPHTIYWVDYLARGLGLGMEVGGFYWILVGVGALTGPLACGWLADRVGFAAALVTIFAVLAVGVAVPVLLAVPATLVLSSLIFGAQPGLSAVISGRTGQVVGRENMAEVWRWMVLSVAVTKAIAGYLMVWLFDLTGSYAFLFMTGGVALALGALLSLPWPESRSPDEAGAKSGTCQES